MDGVMTEYLRTNSEYDNGTRFNGETVVDVHAGNPNLLDLAAAREARIAADAEVAAAREAAAQAETKDSQTAHTLGARIGYYRQDELRLAA